ncbi:MAG: FAD-dependent oxidoreductase [Clostridiales bacterium]|nr:FAD-dependent oxidoreductase [Clostridiales bacterium]
MQYTKKIETRHKVDVFVAGAGPAGIAAAITAARHGKTVFLAENNGCFGGLGTAGLVPAFCQFTDGERFLVGGVGREIRDLTLGPAVDYTARFEAVNPERLKLVYDKLVTDEPNITFSFFTRLIDVAVSDGNVTAAILAAKSGIFAVEADIFIDCTGDGDLCDFAGADSEFGDEEGNAMPVTLCSIWADIDSSKRSSVNFSQALEQAFADGVFSKEDRHISGFFNPAPGHSVRNANIGHCYEVDGRDERSLTRAMMEGRAYMAEFKRFYSEYIGGQYENMHLCWTADMLGVRESRRIITDYMLCGADFKARASFDDEIGRYAYPVDIHAMKPTKEAFEEFRKEYEREMRYGVGESYGIPYRSLLPKKLENVLVAGRCIGTDRQMQASIRPMPGCYITGTAAGIAASMTSKKRSVRSIDIDRLKEAIRADFGKDTI